MAIIFRQGAPAIDYYSQSTQPPQTDSLISPSDIWDSNSHSDSIFTRAESSDSSFASPTEPEDNIFSSKNYNLPRNNIEVDIKSEEAFNFGSFEDWMRWDDPSDAALSPELEFMPELKTEPLSSTLAYPEFSGDSNSRMTINNREDSVEFGRDALSEEPSFPSSETQNSPGENLYSTPLSWSQPLPGTESRVPFGNYLSPQQEARLRDIAMPPSRTRAVNQYPGSPSSDDMGMDNLRKRKSSVDEDDDDDTPLPQSSSSKHPPVKKTAHNMIEKRYRTNLNDKIAALRDSVPSLRVMSRKNSNGEEIHEDLQGLTPAHKLNKATVLSKATEYIAHLEKRNKYLTRENASLKSRIDAFEILVMARQQSLNPTNNPMNDSMAGRSRDSGYMM
ncbi:HLH, helix-loop-helix DNA-binding protein [Glarea lozoyensis ATCC 20868]|uniref:HLH, helix-loop-helix DNA-binding protein n=1 Tax=Glarea lozoyensis (strain ATCC 20868 / MF5171) TaxID=1116229 RepID=S3EFS2_GLAL2|nr:HLH, helix-loop-helix DNA-binding protein [Glarea lozoyensis ATCC 20868]EPE37038.1 HLH, helix-loop-helix DNA-binding protein [Glarea lozoyensis ATCC 20868]